MEHSYRWKRIADLSPNLRTYEDPELRTLSRIWMEQRAVLEQQGIVREFTDKLMRELAIEGGLIERAYTLDRGITLQLIEHGIDASLIPHSATNKDPQLVAALIQDHLDAAHALFDLIHEGRNLTTGFIKQLHSVLMRHQETTQAVDQIGHLVEVPLLKGDYKRMPNNPQRQDGTVHEYCPPEHVAAEMDSLLSMHLAHLSQGIAPEVEAAWLHHAFTQIHPFQDGNGRIARLLATYVFIKHNYFPLVLVNERDRKSYIDALEAADLSGDLSRLIGLFASVQRLTFVKVLSLAGETQREAGLDQLIESAARSALERARAQYQRIEYAKNVGRQLMGDVRRRLEEVEAKLTDKFTAIPPPFQRRFRFYTQSEWNEGEKRYYFRAQVIETARKLDYFANPSAYHDWVRLVLRTDEQSEILISLHVVGYEFRGLLAVSASFFRRSQSEEGATEVVGLTPLSDSWFQVSYLDDYQGLAPRFALWLESALTKGLALWTAGR
jgi:Fic family protein